jgi:hypothetical protein
MAKIRVPMLDERAPARKGAPFALTADEDRMLSNDRNVAGDIGKPEVRAGLSRATELLDQHRQVVMLPT